jgi:hypothetical protein
VPANQTHLVRSTSVIKSISYGASTLTYTTYDATATEGLHMSYNPVTITANGIALPHRTDLSQPGWTLDVATKTLKIYHAGATQIVINPASSGRLITQQQPVTDSIVSNEVKGNDEKKVSAAKNIVDEIKENRLVILPNPTSGSFALNYTTQENGKAVIRITDMSGKLVFTTNKNVNKGQNVIYMQTSAAWRRGVYIIVVTQDKNIQQGKLVYQ